MPFFFTLDFLTGKYALVFISGKHGGITPTIVGANAALTLLGP